MKLLITGGAGQLAHDLIQLAKAQGHTVHAPARAVLDITQIKSVQNAVAEFQPDLVINTAAYNQVDQAQQTPQAAYAVNHEGAKNIAIACAKARSALIHLSTDYVFDGKQTKPYRETDVIAPLSVYGHSKWQGEEAVRNYCEQHFIVRVSSIFGVHGNNFVKSILRLSSEREVLRIIMDKTSCPTSALEIADMLLQWAPLLSDTSVYGTYHFCSNEPVTWYDFAAAIIAQAKPVLPIKTQKIEAITSAEFNAPAPRPAYSVLDCQKIESTLKITRQSWRAGLAYVIDTLSSQ